MTVVVNLSFLGFFKYFNFFIDSFPPLSDLARASGCLAAHAGTSSLPIGISFYTFDADQLHDRRLPRRARPAEKTCSTSPLFIPFFPHLVAGPIVRARDFLPQIREPTASSPRPALVIGLAPDLARAVQEGGVADRWPSVRRPGLRRPGGPFGSRGAARRRARLRDADLLRLLGLHRHRHRLGAHPRAASCTRTSTRPTSPPNLQRVLAALAHLALDLAARLPVHPARRQSSASWNTYRNLLLTMMLGGLVARGRLELRDLGRAAWHVSRVPTADRQAAGIGSASSCTCPIS